MEILEKERVLDGWWAVGDCNRYRFEKLDMHALETVLTHLCLLR